MGGANDFDTLWRAAAKYVDAETWPAYQFFCCVAHGFEAAQAERQGVGHLLPAGLFVGLGLGQQQARLHIS